MFIVLTFHLTTMASTASPQPRILFSPKHYICYRTPGPIQVDGKLNELAWEKAEWTSDFVDIEGPLKPMPRFRTRAKMLWDDAFLYIAAEMEEPHVWATLREHDAVIFHDNDFEVFIDPDGDTHRYYEFEMNAFGTWWDLFLDRPYRNSGNPVNSWEIRGIQVGVAVNGTINVPADRDQGWTVEIAFPFAVLKENVPGGKPPVAGDQYRLNFSRVEWQVDIVDGRYRKRNDPQTGKPLPEDNWVWSPQGLVDMHYPEMWGFLQFSDKIAGNGTDAFKENPEEKTKWLLRQIYYAEHAYYRKHQSYTADLVNLDLKEYAQEVKSFAPEIQHTWQLFEAKLTDPVTTAVWHINSDGRVWKETRE
ncbi:MAG: carbohydrate-binding family 9-like protein [candidate division KSB1 bacterium]|nr:carbohydrate-binding family 9-like protein [candidate division KSB1 bacterium]MDZ7313837.1 carbohydrate-binding family 9-like protein [candidate division KSB1 bacterium]